MRLHRSALLFFCLLSPAAHAAEIDRRYPKILRRVGGYNLDEFRDPSKPVHLAKIMVGSEGTLGVCLKRNCDWCRCPKLRP